MALTRASNKQSLDGNNALAGDTPNNAARSAPSAPQEVIEILDSSDEDNDFEPVQALDSKKRKMPQAESSKRARTDSTLAAGKKLAIDKAKAKIAELEKKLKLAADATNAKVQDLEDQVKASLDRESRLETRLVEAEKVVEKANKNVIHAVDLEEHLSCMICLEQLSQPWILSQCGHAFCEYCLVHWFDAIRAKFMVKYPTFNLSRSYAYTSPIIIARLPTNVQPFHKAANSFPRPTYTCPLCRESVTRQPNQDYLLRHIVDIVEKSTSEKTPEAIMGKGKDKGKGKASEDVKNPWTAFFAPE